MPSLDVFKGDAFNTMSLTASINRLPFQPRRLGDMNLFTPRPITNTIAMIEENKGKLRLLNSAGRGARENVRSRDNRDARAFIVPHVPQYGAIEADDIQDARAFGSETETEVVASVVNDELANMRRDHELTHEWHRIGAIKGVVLDGDASTEIYNFFTEFGVTETSVTFTFATDDMMIKSLEVIRALEDGMGGTPFMRIHAMCGDTFFDSFVTHPDVKEAYARWQQGAFLRADNRAGFPFADIVWENYRGSIGGTKFIDDGEARFFPVGATDAFLQIQAPANFNETVNTRGQLIYAKQQMQDYDMGVDLHSQSNVLMAPTMLSALIKGVAA